MIQPPFPEFLPESSWRPPDRFPNIGEEKWISMDVEARDPHLTDKGPGYIRGDAYIVGVAVHTDGFSGYFPVRHAQGCNIAPNVVFDWLRDQTKIFRGSLYGGNLLYDEEALYHDGVEFHRDVRRCDIQIAEPLINEETAEGYSVEVLSNKYLGVGKEEELLRAAAERYSKGFRDKRAKRPIPFDPKGDLWMLAPEYVGLYAEGDVDRPRRIFQDHQSKILDKEDLWEIFNLESSLIPILLRMRIRGVAINQERAHKLVGILTQQIDSFSLKIKKLVGFDPNVDSNRDVLKAYEVLNFKMPEFEISKQFKYTAPTQNYPQGQASFTDDWYASQRDPLSKLIRKKKKLLTLRDDFVLGDILKESVNGRLHCQFQQLRTDDSGTRSGRMASRNPNLQQVPARHSGCDEDCPDNCNNHLWGKNEPNWAKEVRALFVADEGDVGYLKSDYSQQEPRLLLHFADLCKMPGSDVAVSAFRKNPLTDYHKLTTLIVNEKSGKSFKRSQIKGINLGIMYGMGLKKLCRMLNLSMHEGQEILAAYHDALPFVKGLSSKAMSIAQDRGFVRTLLKRKRRFDLWEPMGRPGEEKTYYRQGFKRHVADQLFPGRRLQRFGVHKALNALIQGSAADQTKKAMQVLFYEHDIVMSVTVHDELGGSVVNVEQARLIKSVMQDCVTLRVPVVADSNIGPSWGEANDEVLLAA